MKQMISLFLNTIIHLRFKNYTQQPSWKKHNMMNKSYRPFSVGVNLQLMHKAGLLTRFGCQYLPGRYCQWSKNLTPFHRMVETYSSGNCCRFSRHSLLIPTVVFQTFGNLCDRKDIHFFHKQTFFRMFTYLNSKGTDKLQA